MTTYRRVAVSPWRRTIAGVVAGERDAVALHRELAHRPVA